MNSFYGGKQGRTYHLVERYDQIYINQSGLESFVEGQYKVGDKFFYQSEIYKVLGQKDEEGKIVEFVNLKKTDLADKEKVAKIKGMVNEFQKGGAYTDANYGEYVIIDTILNENHRNDQINGLIYRRGFDYTEPVASQERPDRSDKSIREFDNPETGEKLTFLLSTYHDYELIKKGGEYIPLDKGFNNDRWTAVWRKYVLKPGGGAIYVGQIVGPQGDAPELQGLSWKEYIQQCAKVGDNILKGQVGASNTFGWDGQKYNDIIQLGYCNIEDKDGNITGCYISFDIPKPVFNISAQQVSPYYKKEGENITFYGPDGEEDIYNTKEDGLIHLHKYSGPHEDGSELPSHPFYYNWNISIPRGKRGTGIDSLDIETAGSGDFSPSVYDDIIEGDQYLTYTIHDYEDSQEGGVTPHQGRWPYRVINTIEPISGRNYFNGWGGNAVEKNFYEAKRPIDRNVIRGFLCIKAGTTPSQPPVWEIQDLGKIITFPNATSEWIVLEIPTREATGQFKIDYTAGKNDNINTRFVDYFYTDKNSDLYVVYSDNQTESPYHICNINSIADVQRLGDSILILYSDPAKRKAIPQNKQYEKDGMIWENFGSLGSQYHVHGDVTYEQLKNEYAQGLNIIVDSNGVNVAPDRQGWIVSVTTTTQQGEEIVRLYAFDYQNYLDQSAPIRPKHRIPDPQNPGTTIPSYWYEIMSVAESVAGNPDNILLVAEPEGGNPPIDSDKLKEHGLWLVVSGGHDDEPPSP